MKRTALAVSLAALFLGLGGCGSSYDERLSNAEGPCREFEQVFTVWSAEYYRYDAELIEEPPAPETVVDVATQVAEDVRDEGAREEFAQLSSEVDDPTSFNFAGESVLTECQALGVEVSVPEIPEDVRAAVAEEEEGEFEPEPRAEESDQNPVPDASLQRKALELMWTSISQQERESTCLSYAQAPESLIDGFMSLAEGKMSEQVVRDFYDEMC